MGFGSWMFLVGDCFLGGCFGGVLVGGNWNLFPGGGEVFWGTPLDDNSLDHVMSIIGSSQCSRSLSPFRRKRRVEQGVIEGVAV